MNTENVQIIILYGLWLVKNYNTGRPE